MRDERPPEATIPDPIEALEAAVLALLDDRDTRRQAWSRYTDDPFEAGYATAITQVGELLGSLRERSPF